MRAYESQLDRHAGPEAQLCEHRYCSTRGRAGNNYCSLTWLRCLFLPVEVHSCPTECHDRRDVCSQIVKRIRPSLFDGTKREQLQQQQLDPLEAKVDAVEVKVDVLQQSLKQMASDMEEIKKAVCK
jgi:hypothetical protein